MKTTRSVIMDVGTLHTKVGLDGEAKPRVIASVLAKQKISQASTRNVLLHLQNSLVSPRKEYMIGKEIKNQTALNMALFHPIERGRIKDIRQVEKLWEYLYQVELKVNASECNLLLVDNVINSEESKQREQCAQILFESFQVPSLYFEHQSVLSMFGTGNLTGLLIDSGYGLTHTIPFYDGIPIREGIEVSNFGSQDLDQFLVNCLYNLSQNVKLSQIKHCSKYIKEEMCFIKKDPLVYSDCKPYELPDGTMVALRNELFEGGELFFRHQLADKSFNGIQHMVKRSILKCGDSDLHNDLYSNIVLSGGNCKLFGLDKRVKRELIASSNNNNKKEQDFKVCVNSKCHHDKECLAFIGGSIICSMSSMKKAWTLKREYDEIGSNCILRQGMLIID